MTSNFECISKLVSFLLICTISITNGLDEESAKEQPCFEISKTVKIDLQWVRKLGSTKKFYFPLMSRLDLYRLSKDFFPERKMKDISEAEVYYENCLELSPNPTGGFVQKGFNGITFIPGVKPLGPYMERMEFSTHDNKGYSGIYYTTLTDNKSFVFFACCANDDQMAWGVISPTKTLPKETTKLIHEHAVSLGFKKEYFTALRYDSCGTADAPEGVCDKTNNDGINCASS